ncbi:MAG: hypothetical protein RLZZ404_542 [Actinomycetota bacterium]
MSRANALHPVTWWILGLWVSAAAIISTSFSPLLVLICLSFFLAVVFEPKWFSTMRLYALLALLVFVTRILFRLIFSYSAGDGPVLLSLPTLSINLGIGGPVNLLGQISQSAIELAIVDGLRLAAIVLSIGMATTLCHPRNLLKSTPGALYEIAAAVSMAINLAPQLVMSAQRVRQASRLRGRSRKLGAMKSIVIPILEDTIESSMGLAASMSSRGFGRQGFMTIAQRRTSRILSIIALSLLLIGIYLTLTSGFSKLATVVALILGLALSAIVIKFSSNKKIRTSLAKRKLTSVDYLAILLGGIPFTLISFGWWI